VLRRLAIDKATVSAVARELGRSWDTVNAIAVEATGELLLTAGPARLDGVRVIGVDEHAGSHTRAAEADGFVTVITDLTAIFEGTGPARLLDLVPGRSAAALTGWLAAREQAFRDRVEIVAMDGFGGYKTAATAALPEAVTVMDPYHVVALVGHKLDLCRQRVQQDTLGHRGRTGDPLYRVRRTLRTRLGLLTDRQRARLEAVFAADEHAAVEVTWWSYQADHRRLRRAGPGTREDPAHRRDRLAPGRAAGRARGAGHPRPDAAPATRRRPGLLHPPRIERPDRGHQRPPRSPPPQRPRVPQFDQLPHPVLAALRISCTLISEEPV
jgi:transposase